MFPETVFRYPRNRKRWRVFFKQSPVGVVGPFGYGTSARKRFSHSHSPGHGHCTVTARSDTGAVSYRVFGENGKRYSPTFFPGNQFFGDRRDSVERVFSTRTYRIFPRGAHLRDTRNERHPARVGREDVIANANNRKRESTRTQQKSNRTLLCSISDAIIYDRCRWMRPVWTTSVVDVHVSRYRRFRSVYRWSE